MENKASTPASTNGRTPVYRLVGYKVVTRTRDGRLFSALCFTKSEGMKEYKVGRYVFQRKGFGPLAVFRSKDEAECYAGGFSQYAIFECEYVESGENKLYTPEVVTPKTICPPGTRFAKAVKLIKEVS